MQVHGEALLGASACPEHCLTRALLAQGCCEGECFFPVTAQFEPGDVDGKGVAS